MYFSLKNRAFRAVLYTASALRIKHFRGHGVHSPFVYSMVRRAFMKSKFICDDRELYDRLREEHCDRRSARQLQNLYNLSSYSSFCLVNSSNIDNYRSERSDIGSNFVVVMHSVETEQIGRILDAALELETPVAVIYPRNNKHRLKLCQKYILSHRYLTIDNRRYILFYSDRKLPRQHFKL